MEPGCPACGHAGPSRDGEAGDGSAEWFGLEERAEPVDDGPRSDRARLSRPVQVVLAGVVAWLGFVTLASWLGGSSPPTSGEAATAADPAAETATADRAADQDDPGETGDPSTKADPAPDDAGPDDADADPDPDPDAGDAGAEGDPAGVAITAIHHLAIDRLNRLDGDGAGLALAYRVPGGVAILDVDASVHAVAPIRGTEPTVLGLANGPMTTGHPFGFETVVLAAGRSTVAIDPDAMTVRELAGDGAIYVKDRFDDWYVLTAEALAMGRPPVLYLGAGGTATTVWPPAGYLLEPYPGLGLLAVPKLAGGQTLAGSPTVFTSLSPGRVFAGSGRAVAESICSEGSCDAQVRDLETGSTYAIPPDFIGIGDRFELAPDGQALLRITRQGYAEILFADGGIAFVASRGAQGVEWSPDSALVVWLDLVEPATLNAMFVETRDWFSVELAELGVAAPIGVELAVLESLGLERPES